MKKIKNLEQANEALYRLSEIDLVKAKAESKQNETVMLARKAAEDIVSPFKIEYDQLLDMLETYSVEHKDELFVEKKSLDLSNGIIGFRQSPDKVDVGKETAEKLIAAGFANCVKVVKEPVKAALKGFTDEQLSSFGAVRIPGQENFYAKPNNIQADTALQGVA